MFKLDRKFWSPDDEASSSTFTHPNPMAKKKTWTTDDVINIRYTDGEGYIACSWSRIFEALSSGIMVLLLESDDGSVNQTLLTSAAALNGEYTVTAGHREWTTDDPNGYPQAATDENNSDGKD